MSRIICFCKLERDPHGRATLQTVKAGDGHDYIVLVGGQGGEPGAIIHAQGCESCAAKPKAAAEEKTST
jgi:hypothetical protein